MMRKTRILIMGLVVALTPMLLAVDCAFNENPDCEVFCHE